MLWDRVTFRKVFVIGAAALAVVCSNARASDAKGAATIRNIGSQLELFVDDWLIETMSNTSLRMHPPVRKEVVFNFNAPWEGGFSAYVTIMKDRDRRFRMYYRGGGELSREYTCMAESRDGIHWTRPSLGLFEFNGSKNNNIIWTGQKKAYWESHNFSPFKDTNPAAPPSQRYKAVTLGRRMINGNRQKVLLAFVSPDGIHWKRLQDAPIITEGSFDSHNTAFWDSVQQQYVCYFRQSREGKRSIRRSVSKDFVHWSRPQWLDFGRTPLEQFYTNGIVPYLRNPHIYLGFPMRFVPERTHIGLPERKTDALSDAVMISSRDGITWDRTFMEAFIRPGLDQANWGGAHGNNTPAWGIIQTSDTELSLYVSEHYGNFPKGANKVPRLRRCVLRVDGFVSVNALYNGGEMLTKPFIFKGTKLLINYSTSAVGSIKVEIQDQGGTAISGFSLAEATEIYGDEIERAVSWKHGTDVSRLAGRPIRLRFVMKDADLYSMRFVP
jgi:hypothetical protein